MQRLIINSFPFIKILMALLFFGLLQLKFGKCPAFATENYNKLLFAKYKYILMKNENYFPVLLKTIDEAKSEIFMSVFSFKAGEHKSSYPDQIADHLARAVKRGVKVFVVLERTGKKSDELDIQNRKTGKLLEEKGINVYFDSPYKTTHTKLVVVDRRVILLGSHNFTHSALKYNNEISVMLNNPDMADEARNYILKIIREAK